MRLIIIGNIKISGIDEGFKKASRGFAIFLFLLFLTARAQCQVKFIPNQGQWPEKAKFRADLVNGHLWLTDSGLLFNFWDADAASKMHDRTLNNFILHHHAFYLHFENASFDNIEALNTDEITQYSYFLGNDPKRWASGLHSSAELLVHNLYDGVDLRIFSSDGNLKYNLECNGSDAVDRIKMRYIGVDGVELKDNHIQLYTSLGDFVEAMPLVYSESPSGRQNLSASYSISGDVISFNLLGNAAQLKNSENRIIIDPILVFSTYTGSTADNFGCTGTYDDWGNGFAGGTVFGVGLPVSTGAYQTTFGGGPNENIGYGDGRDAAILKFNPAGNQLLFCTYLGGNNNEQPHSMVATASGDLYVMGSTRSKNFPVTGGYDISQNGDYDFFVALLSADGKTLKASTFVGGSGLDAVGANREAESIDNFPLLYNYADEFRGEILTDGNAVYVSGVTYSFDFPRSSNSGWFGGKEDACLFCLTPNLDKLNWSQLMGKNGHDAFYGIALGKHNDIYASGGTTSNNLPDDFKVFGNTYIGGMADGIVARFNKSTGKLLSARYLGTNSYEQAYFVQTDNAGNPYLYGQTEGQFPQLNSAFYQKGTGQFIIRYDSTLSAVTMSTSFGAKDNNPNLSPSAFLVDECERIFISGWGGDVNNYLVDIFTGDRKVHRNVGNTRGLLTTPDAQQPGTDGSDFYVAVFAKNMNSLLYATFFGGIGSVRNPAEEHVDGGTSRFDKKGIIYQSVCAGCGRNGLFPTTQGAYSRTNNSHNCNNALFKIDFENLNKTPVMPDTFIKITATEDLQFSLSAIDPDPFDFVSIEIESVSKPGDSSDMPFIRIEPGTGFATFSVHWKTLCKSSSSDTTILKLLVHDKGCPKSDSSYAVIKILIEPPPVVNPPETVCVSFDNDNGQVKITWKASEPPGKYFKYLLLKRVNPDNSVTVLDTIRNTDAGEFFDKTSQDPKKFNYCYYLSGFNICDVEVKAKFPYCSVVELNNPIEGVRLKYATVQDDKRVKVAWETSTEPDFKEYEIFRFKRGETAMGNIFKSTTDTFLLDSGFNVDDLSFCYIVLVADQCQHHSDSSNIGCNVVISGTATGKPKYYFDLFWQPYIGWQQGVSQWILERKYNNIPWTEIARTSGDRFARDSKLDFDWGGYWYRVTAIENSKGLNHQGDSSQSNWTYLYQPPEVYVPSGITVNGDGLNDIWGTVPVFVKDYEMSVYNRWGQKVWTSTDKKRQWNGDVYTVVPEDGVFAWNLIFTGWDSKTYHMTGTVTLLH